MAKAVRITEATLEIVNDELPNSFKLRIDDLGGVRDKYFISDLAASHPWAIMPRNLFTTEFEWVEKEGYREFAEVVKRDKNDILDLISQ